MQISEKSSTCCKVAKSKQRQYTWLPAVLIAVLPKCPFCVMAYSGAVSMCSGNNFYPHAGSNMSYISLFLASIILLGIVLNYKGQNTLIALTLAILGIGLVYISQFIFLSALYYYLGAGLLFFGIWYNGSFNYFYRRYFRKDLHLN